MSGIAFCLPKKEFHNGPKGSNISRMLLFLFVEYSCGRHAKPGLSALPGGN